MLTTILLILLILFLAGGFLGRNNLGWWDFPRGCAYCNFGHSISNRTPT